MNTTMRHVTIRGGMREFVGRTGTVQGKEGHHLHLQTRLEQIDMTNPWAFQDGFAGRRRVKNAADLLRGWAAVNLATRREMVAEARRHLADLPPHKAALLLREIEAVEVHCNV
jgi:hypothetical protein